LRRRILLLITDLEIGGTPTVVRELARRLRCEDVHVEVACLSKWGPTASIIQSDGIHATALNAAFRADFRVLHRLNVLIKSRKIDTVFSFLIHANTVAAASKLFCRDVRYFQSIQTTQPHPVWHWKLQRLIHRAAEKIVVPSRSVTNAAHSRSGVPLEKIVEIPNAVDPAEFELQPFEADLQKPVAIGFIGRLDPVKRLPDLLMAVQKLGDSVHLHIFGDGIERHHIEQEMMRLGIEDRVVLHGAVARPQDALKQIRILVLPSIAEGFGLVLIEAMASGVAVVATNVPGICDVVKDGVTGLLAPAKAPGELASAIDRLIDDSDLRKHVVQAGLTDVKTRFTWNSVLERYRQILL
jgi:glycosyltransferase involved in cell wall biosynthesis